MEKLHLRSCRSLGTIVSIVGAFIVTFCKGPSLLTAAHSSSSRQLLLQQSNRVIGGFLIAADSVFASA